MTKKTSYLLESLLAVLDERSAEKLRASKAALKGGASGSKALVGSQLKMKELGSKIAKHLARAKAAKTPEGREKWIRWAERLKDKAQSMGKIVADTSKTDKEGNKRMQTTVRSGGRETEVQTTSFGKKAGGGAWTGFGSAGKTLLDPETSDPVQVTKDRGGGGEKQHKQAVKQAVATSKSKTIRGTYSADSKQKQLVAKLRAKYR